MRKSKLVSLAGAVLLLTGCRGVYNLLEHGDGGRVLKEQLSVGRNPSQVVVDPSRLVWGGIKRSIDDQLLFSNDYDSDGNGVRDLRLIYLANPSDSGGWYVSGLIGYAVDSNNDGNFGEDEIKVIGEVSE